MSYIKIINEDEATGTVAQDYAYLAKSYATLFGAEIPTPNVFRPPSLIPAYFRFGAAHNRATSNNGAHDIPEQGPMPGMFINFAVALYSSCFY